MSRKYDNRDEGYSKRSEKVPYHKQNDDFPEFDIAKNLKGSLPREEVEDLFSVRVTNLKDVIKSELFSFFKDYDVADIHIPWEHGKKTADGKPLLKGFAFVRFKEEKDADDAVKALDNTTLKGLAVGIARTIEKKKKPYYSYREGGSGNYQKGYDRGGYQKPDYRKQNSFDRQGDYRGDREVHGSDYYTQHGSRGQHSYSRPAPYERNGYGRQGPPRYQEEPYPKRSREPEVYDSYERRDFRAPRGYHPEQGSYRENAYNNYGPRNHYQSSGGGEYIPSEGKRRRFNNYESNSRDGYQNPRNYQRDPGYSGPNYGYNNSGAPSNSRGGYERRGPKHYQHNRSEKRY